jgi:hypothetical protein
MVANNTIEEQLTELITAVEDLVDSVSFKKALLDQSITDASGTWSLPDTSSGPSSRDVPLSAITIISKNVNTNAVIFWRIVDAPDDLLEISGYLEKDNNGTWWKKIKEVIEEVGFVTIGDNYTLTTDDFNSSENGSLIYYIDSVSNVVLYLPANYDHVGKTISVIQANDGFVSISAQPGDSNTVINVPDTYYAQTRAKWSTLTILCTGFMEFLLMGDLANEPATNNNPQLS